MTTKSREDVIYCKSVKREIKLVPYRTNLLGEQDLRCGELCSRVWCEHNKDPANDALWYNLYGRAGLFI